MRDVLGCGLQAGAYVLTQPGSKPAAATVFEDPLTSDLWLRTQAGNQRVDELAPDVLLHPMANSESAEAVVDGLGGDVIDQVSAVLRDAADARGTLKHCSVRLGDLLGCVQGDGSDLADAVFAAVYDGTGSAIALVEAAGGLEA